MSTIESIFKEAKTRCDLLRESIDRGLYDSPQPAKKNAFQEKLQEIIQDGQDQIKQYYKQKHGIKYRFKNKNAEDSDKERLFQMVFEYGEDLTNRLALLNYYIKNQSQLNDPKKCRDMSQSKCIRADNINDCYWVPGGNELGEWAMRSNGKGIVINKPVYIGVGTNQKPRGCYPIRKGENPEKILTSRKNARKTFRNIDEFNAIMNNAEKKSSRRELTEKELNIMQLKRNNKPKTNAQIAENQINSSNTSKFTKAQLNRRKNRQSKKAQRKREMNAMLERLKGMRKTRDGAASKMNNTRMGGGRHRRKTKKKPKRSRKNKSRAKRKGGSLIGVGAYEYQQEQQAIENGTALYIPGQKLIMANQYNGIIMFLNDPVFRGGETKSAPEEGVALTKQLVKNSFDNLIGKSIYLQKAGSTTGRRWKIKVLKLAMPKERVSWLDKDLIGNYSDSNGGVIKYLRLPVPAAGGGKRRTRRKTKKTRKKRGGKRKMTAKQYWKSGRFSGKTWWMPRYMKSASWFKDTLKYGIPI